jgi:hypothetical protein
VGETRVDLFHLLEDLRDAYPGSLEETILTEVIANALDSGASRIDLRTEPAVAALTIVDNGSGMKRQELARYHDVAATTKRRGEGIGFAGVGIKLGLLVAEEVLTETRRGKTHVATSWRLASRRRAPWKWVPPPGLVDERGTGVRLTLQNTLSPLLDAGFLEQTLRLHFAPLLDPRFGPILQPHYPAGVALVLNGGRLHGERHHAGDEAQIEIRLARKRKPSAVGSLLRTEAPLVADRQGIAISTYGKVIKRGWDWLGLAPAAADRVGGLVEAPGLSAGLTLNKGDFVRAGPRGAVYLGYRKAIQEAVSRQLAIWGDTREPAAEPRPKVTGLERDLRGILEELADAFPLLGSLVERRRGGQKRLPWDGGTGKDEPIGLVHASLLGAAKAKPPPAEPRPGEPQPAGPGAGGSPAPPPETLTEPPSPGALPPLEPDTSILELPGHPRRQRAFRYGLQVDFEDRPDDDELARLVESTVWINRAHPAYRRAVASRSAGYHIALGVALALAPLAADPSTEHRFVTAFLARWGEALDRPRRRR